MEKRIFLLLLVILFWNLTFTAVDGVSVTVRVPVCAMRSVKDYTLGFRDQSCPVYDDDKLPERPHFTEGDERWLQIAFDMIHKNKCDYVALLFYASWCPFSRSFTPTFDLISSLYSSIPHFAIKESSVKPSTLSKYGVHGFPTLLLMNSTMRARYRGTRMLDSLVAFYRDVTGIETLDQASLERSLLVPHLGNGNNTEPENCPFTWARSPENMLRQETYLTLAILFVLLRLLHFVFPALVVFAKFTWPRIARNMRLESLQEHTVGFLSRLCLYLKEPCKRSNLQGGAMNARAWASKSLATVTIGESSSSNRASSASQ
ncbi:5'-adenylylsulfate reductase-like 4 [Raphanus sativus]|uniref:5'-adenylylsulfate reductase-like 4 n=1 Tax=Raphanus sativus TaxID=3726 RepID=A0A6J0KJH3_RAPSA|nr:5'-adenylylsulfate reductase-like 4 [Raphanus sativus]KAJ4881449.1 5'-adenylylsulfate reductase-like 4 [Raphanus sativus]